MKRKALPDTIHQEPAQLDSKAAPFAVYFPSGFDPATGVKWASYTDTKRNNSVVVGKGEFADFIGTCGEQSRDSESSCRMAFGIFDRSTGSLRLVPAKEEVLRMEARVHGVSYCPSPDDAAKRAAEEENRQAASFRLVEQLGSQRRRRQLLAREAARVDASHTVSSAAALRAQVGRAAEGLDTKEDMLAAVLAARPLPPHDPQATTAAAAYPVRGGLVWEGVWDALPAAELLEAAQRGGDAAGSLRADGTILGDYVEGRVADSRNGWQKPASGEGALERARLLALVDAGMVLVTRHAFLRGGFGGRREDALAERTGLSSQLLAAMLAKFYTHHPPDVTTAAGERYALAPKQKELLLNWIVVAALRAEIGSVLDARQVADLAAALQMTQPALLARCRELGAKVQTARGQGSRVALLPKSTSHKTLASYFPELKIERKRGGNRG